MKLNWFKRCGMVVCIGVMGVETIAADRSVAKFESGDRVCFIGDSITHDGSYHRQIVLFYATRFPQKHFTSWNSGISGDSASGALRRYNRDIAPHKPTVATIMFGMNDIDRENYGKAHSGLEDNKLHMQSIGRFDAAMIELASRLTRDGAKLIFITPTIYDQTGTQKCESLVGVDNALEICADHVRSIAVKYNAGIVDFHAPMAKLNAEIQATNPHDTIVGDDRIHPGPVGHLVMAYWFLKTQGMTPTVATMGIDAAASRIAVQDNCRISNFIVQQDRLGFDVLENALPFPVDESAAHALDLVPFINELNREALTVTGLVAGTYELLIDNQKIGQYHADELQDGINLAGIKITPQYRQAMEVKALLQAHDQMVAERLRTIEAIRHFTLAKTSVVEPMAIRKMLENELEKHRANKFNYGVMQVETYLKYAAEEDNLKKDAERLYERAFTHNRPVDHHFELRRIVK